MCKKMKNFFLDHINFVSNPKSFHINRFAKIIYSRFFVFDVFYLR